MGFFLPLDCREGLGLVVCTNERFFLLFRPPIVFPFLPSSWLLNETDLFTIIC